MGFSWHANKEEKNLLAPEDRQLTEKEMQRLVNVFEILITIDRRNNKQAKEKNFKPDQSN